jgi:hypothetical protein
MPNSRLQSRACLARPVTMLHRLTLALLPSALSLAAAAATPPAYAADTPQQDWQANPAQSPLVEKVRAATARFKDINVATSEGWVQGTPCVSGPDTGAMGVHFVMPARINNFVLQPDRPQALIYEPMPGGAFRLVGVEFIVLASVWQSQPDGATSTPALEGDLMNYISAPNRYGLPAFYELHVWTWEDNPKGSFADWNTRVTCAKQGAK